MKYLSTTTVVFFNDSPFLLPIILISSSIFIAIFCYVSDPKDQHNPSFAGLVIAGLMFCIGFHYLVKEVVQ